MDYKFLQVMIKTPYFLFSSKVKKMPYFTWLLPLLLLDLGKATMAIFAYLDKKTYFQAIVINDVYLYKL